MHPRINRIILGPFSQFSISNQNLNLSRLKSRQLNGWLLSTRIAPTGRRLLPTTGGRLRDLRKRGRISRKGHLDTGISRPIPIRIAQFLTVAHAVAV